MTGTRPLLHNKTQDKQALKFKVQDTRRSPEKIFQTWLDMVFHESKYEFIVRRRQHPVISEIGGVPEVLGIDCGVKRLSWVKESLRPFDPLDVALGWLLEEIHVTWAFGENRQDYNSTPKSKKEKGHTDPGDGVRSCISYSSVIDPFIAVWQIERGMMGEIDISTLTVEQYFRMIDENHAPGMVNEEFGRTMEKDIEDMTIVEYIKYEAEMKRQSWRDSQSYFPTKYDNWMRELDEEINYMSDEESLMSEQGTVVNVLVKIDKFVSPCDFVVIDMSGICGEMMILGKPFLATIHAQIYVFNGEISFGTSEDRVKFNVNRISHHSNAILEKVYMTTEKESFNPLEIEDGLFSYESPACLQFEQNTRIYTNSDNETIDSPTNMQETSKSGYESCLEECVTWDCSNNGIPSIIAALHPDNIHCPTPSLLQNSPHDDWHTKNHTTYNIGSSSDQSMPITTREWLKVKIGHTRIAKSDREKVLNEWVLDSFDVEADYANMFSNPYSRRFDEYKRIFINEVLSAKKSNLKSSRLIIIWFKYYYK
ncbi:RNA-directed DNA polymerase, eukaryota, reverse transcriptase zinc-binding domain protein [Tanacetum coccineum]